VKIFVTITNIFVLVLLFAKCTDTIALNKKDLDENMLDMMVYHDNLGMYLREKDLDNAEWLLEGMDSSLQVIAAKFTTHRKLSAPFEKYYKKRLAPPIDGIRQALKQKDFSSAIIAYRKLTKNCNGCHIDNDIDKEVVDWSDPTIH
jgi:hypothetical protein